MGRQHETRRTPARNWPAIAEVKTQIGNAAVDSIRRNNQPTVKSNKKWVHTTEHQGIPCWNQLLLDPVQPQFERKTNPMDTVKPSKKPVKGTKSQSTPSQNDRALPYD